MLDEVRADINRLVTDLTEGSEFSLRTLFGGRERFAEKIPNPGKRKWLGVEFRAAVLNGEFQNISYLYHCQSPAEHWYKRILYIAVSDHHSTDNEIY